MNVALGFSSLVPYLGNHPFFGALVGRFANRIRSGEFELDGTRYQLEKNNLGNHLHGGEGFDKRIWGVEIEDHKAILKLVSQDGDQGYPGNVSVTVEYEFTEDLCWHIRYHATTDKKTIINLTNHSYFNLAGALSGGISSHELRIRADQYIPIDATFIPLDKSPIHVKDSPFDFLDWKMVGKEIDSDHEQIKKAGGYDHCWVRSMKKATNPEPLAEIREPSSGIILNVQTTEPGVQFFSGNYPETVIGEDGKEFPPRAGFCLETQHFPDSPNRPDFPTTVLEPNKVFESETIFKFSTF
jgi:aldose 1-epimerase